MQPERHRTIPSEDARRHADRPHEEPVFDEPEEWPDMFENCESLPLVLDNEGANANRFASLRTVVRKP
jgi:hypothetical protein